MVTAGHSIDSVQGTSAGHRLPAMAFRWPALAHRSVCVRRWRADVHHWLLLAIVGQLLVNDGKFLLRILRLRGVRSNVEVCVF